MEEKIIYYGEVVTADSYYKHVLWAADRKHFAVARQCPLCDTWCGTGVQYNADEPIYSVAVDYATSALLQHIQACHS